jgi:hypothetical protein
MSLQSYAKKKLNMVLLLCFFLSHGSSIVHFPDQKKKTKKAQQMQMRFFLAAEKLKDTL